MCLNSKYNFFNKIISFLLSKVISTYRKYFIRYSRRHTKQTKRKKKHNKSIYLHKETETSMAVGGFEPPTFYARRLLAVHF